MRSSRSMSGKTECFCHDGKTAGFAALDYRAEFQDQSVPVQLMVTECTAFDGEEIDDFLRSQMWDCLEDRDRILGNCRYRVIATDMLARALPAAKRATLDMDFLEALSELYPDCEAFYFPSSGKLFTAESVRRDETEGTNRFIYFGVNVRFFNVQDSEDMVVDTLGMSTLFSARFTVPFPRNEPELGCESRLQCSRLSAFQRKRNCGRGDGGRCRRRGDEFQAALVLPL